jgi:hypothetical protein
MRLSDWPDPSITPTIPPSREHGKIQGNPICAADPNPADAGHPAFQPLPTSHFEHSTRAFTKSQEEGNNYVNVLPRHVGCIISQSAYLDAQVGSLLLGLEHSLRSLSFFYSPCLSHRRRCLQ